MTAHYRVSLPIYAAAALALFLFGCGKPQVDVHDPHRETKAYETVDLESLDSEGLISHLNELQAETGKAVEGNLYGEMHHLEIALTSAIQQLSTKLPEDQLSKAQPALEDLKIIAAQLHTAGHDQNSAMAGKLNLQLQKNLALLKEAVN